MKPSSIRALMFLLLIAGLVVTLRQDLENLALYHGNARLKAGDDKGAEAAFSRAAALGAAHAPLSYNLGVSLYRKGDYPRASKQFAAALANAEPNLVIAIHYNLGNSQFLQAERLAAANPEAAHRLMTKVVADYGLALAQAPNASDIEANLNLARVRLAALGERLEMKRGQGEKRPGAQMNRSDKSTAGSGAKSNTDQSRPTTGSPPKTGAQEAARADRAASGGNTRPELTRSQAERLLNEARGREKPTGLLHADKQNGPSAKPDKDW